MNRPAQWWGDNWAKLRCKCGARPDTVIGRDADNPAGLPPIPQAPFCLPCLERDHPDIYALIPDAKAFAAKHLRRKEAN